MPPTTLPTTRPTTPWRTAAAAFCAASALLGSLVTVLASPAQAAVAPTRVEPDTLARGADPAVAHVDGTTLVDGTFRVALDADRIELLGRSGGDYLVSSYGADGRAAVVRVSPAGAVTPVLSPARNGDQVRLSTDGSRLAQVKVKGGFTSSTVTVWSSTDGAVIARRTFPGIQTVLDLDRRRVVVGDLVRTRVWRTGTSAASGGTGAVSVLVQRGGYRADIAADRLATLTGDPYDGGCTVVSRLTDPTKQLWRSCAERVESFSPGGKRMATVDLLSDGIGPGQVLTRSATGKVKGVYRVKGYFGTLTWENPRSLLLETYGRAQGATVRCTGSTCQRAGDLVATPAAFTGSGASGIPAPFRQG